MAPNVSMLFAREKTKNRFFETKRVGKNEREEPESP
jgi:hypothetical protein